MRPPEAACIGTGIIGRSWALVLARCHERVWLFDANNQAAEAAQGYVNDMMAAHTPEFSGRVRVAPSLKDAVSAASYVQESVSENLEVKRALFPDIDRLAPRDAILVSSTSEFRPT